MKSVSIDAVIITLLLFFAQPASTLSSGQREGSPVEKVVKLVEQLKKDILEDGRQEELIYDKYACWCEKTSKRKGAAIEKAREELKALGTTILGLKAEVTKLATEIKEGQDSLTENEEKQKELTETRQKEHNSYSALSAEYKQALTALSKMKFFAGLQTNSTDGASLQQAVSSLKALLNKLPESTIGSLPQANLVLLKQLSSDVAKLQGKTSASFTPMSDTLATILKSLHKTLFDEATALSKAEKLADATYEDLLNNKMNAMKALQEEMLEDDAQKAEKEEDLAAKAQLYDDITNTRDADIDFFNTMEQNCKDKNDEWEKRKTTRASEIKGIDEALVILTSDSARDIFQEAAQPGVATEKPQHEYAPATWEAESKTLKKKHAFLQVDDVKSSSSVMAKALQKAYQVLKVQASKSHSLRLAELASKISLAQQDEFKDVLAAIDGVIAELEKEEKEDAEKRDQCIETYKDLKSKIEDLEWKIEKNTAKLNKIQMSIEDAEKKKAETIAMIEETEDQLKESKDQRSEAQGEYEKAKKLDEDAIDLLKKAKTALMAYWKKIGEEQAAAAVKAGDTPTSLLAQPVFERSPDEAPEAKFSAKGDRAAQTKGITTLLQKIIEELENEISVATAENKAQIEEFDAFQAKGNKYKELLGKQNTALEDFIAAKGTDKTAETTAKEGNEASLKKETDFKKDIKEDCDWVLKTFDDRRDARKAEMTGLVDAKKYLLGAEKA